MMRHILTACLTLPLLAGCGNTTLRGIQQRQPDFSADSAKSVAALSSCLSNAWIELNQKPNSTPRENGMMVYVAGNQPFLVANVDARAEGSHLTFWMWKGPFPGLNAKSLRSVKDCI